MMSLSSFSYHDPDMNILTAAGSKTVLAVGPGPASIVDLVNGGLKLYWTINPNDEDDVYKWPAAYVIHLISTLSRFLNLILLFTLAGFDQL